MFTIESASYQRKLIAIGACLLCTGAARAAMPAYGPKIMYTFAGGTADGAIPVSAPTQGLDGNYYGATLSGGANSNGTNGTLYRLTPGGQITTLYSFSTLLRDYSNSDGAGTIGPLAHDNAGTFYGATAQGGVNARGVVYSITPSGTFTVVHAFTAVDGNYNNPDGSYPSSALSRGPDGSLYGTTSMGGTGGGGVLYKIAPGGLFSVVHNFTLGSGTEGYQPYGVTVAPDGTIYGTDVFGGPFLRGCLYKIATDGTFSVLYAFGITTPDGAGPNPGPVILGNDAQTLYGILGTMPSSVFKLTPDGQFTTLYTASSADANPWTFGNSDGDGYSSLAMGADGSLYVTATAKGPFAGVVYPPPNWIPGGGTLLRISPTGQALVLDFLGANPTRDGFTPAPLQFDSNGTLWGAAETGGTHNVGFLFTMPLNPPSTWGSVTPDVAASIKPRIVYADSGRTATLNWKSSSAETCYMVGNSMATGKEIGRSGSMTITPPAVNATTTFHYQISCTTGGKAAEASATLTVKEL